MSVCERVYWVWTTWSVRVCVRETERECVSVCDLIVVLVRPLGHHPRDVRDRPEVDLHPLAPGGGRAGLPLPPRVAQAVAPPPAPVEVGPVAR